MSETKVDGRFARSQQTQQQLLKAAREILERQGLASLTMSALATKAGVSRRTVYLHFSSRADILQALFGYLGSAGRLAETLDRVWQAPDSIVAVQLWAQHIAIAHPKIMTVSRSLEGVRGAEPEAATMWDQAMSGWQAGARRLVDWLNAEGHLSGDWTVESATDGVWALMSFELLERLTVDRGWSTEQYAGFMESTLLRTFTDHAG